MARYKLVALDLDQTLWDHSDISSTEPPFQRLERDAIIDSKGVLVRLREGAREALIKLKSRGLALAVVSWNVYSKAVEALKELDILHFFDITLVEPHPHKDLMFKELLKWGLDKGIRAVDVVFVDDNPDMVEKVKRAYPEVTVLRFGSDVKSFEQLLNLVLQDG